ncbi:hypothetical protein EVAR_33826_1 [Eumeta japonica]|uniref:Uncharacterized protein n=1 Tax=Eumeta variegata TaxID=151549 RepID=A0A4C1VA89_EUMVA|nr:hypothetical protein EVAR_33826_1 [Eumeta japonica]
MELRLVPSRENYHILRTLIQFSPKQFFTLAFVRTQDSAIQGATKPLNYNIKLKKRVSSKIDIGKPSAEVLFNGEPLYFLIRYNKRHPLLLALSSKRMRHLLQRTTYTN